MKKLIPVVVALMIVSAMAFRLMITLLPLGAVLPNASVKMKDVSGKEVCIKEVAKDNGVLVMFSCNTCPYVLKNEQRTIAVCQYAQKMKIGVILLNSNEAQRTSDDSFDEMKKYSEKKYNWNYVVDKNNEMADAFGANRTPECFLFDKNLKLVYHGAIDDNPSDETQVTRQHLKEAINDVVAGKEVVVKESKSVGCTIKRANKM